eukprot:gene12324-15494_t
MSGRTETIMQHYMKSQKHSQQKQQQWCTGWEDAGMIGSGGSARRPQQAGRAGAACG